MAGPAAQIMTWQCQAEDGSLSSVTVQLSPLWALPAFHSKDSHPHLEAHPGANLA